jgi:DTW domain-containing protein YfiP
LTETCPTCELPTPMCVCDRAAPQEIRTRVLVLQHPREPGEILATVPIVSLMLPHTVVKVGLSWPSLAKALGRDEVDPKRWGVLWRGQLPRDLTPEEEKQPFLVLDARGRPAPDTVPLEGVVVLDGTWSQAKTLWWRNPWLLKLQRVLLWPAEPSIYGRLRREPRREAVSTLEAIADALVGNGEDPAVRDALRRAFRTMVQRARDAKLA